ncbi:glycosyltransferase family 2 protein [Mesorhizobium japonicum]|uniref:glycosyltransferase family 2 protein n=1 Tax=Mesorhizobium japonicum TaxID=2066070 RepID=UPI003B5ABE41
MLFVNGSRDVDIHESVPRPATMDLYATYFHATTDAEFARYVSEIWISGGGWDETPDDLTHASESRGVPIRQLTDESATKYTETDSYLAFSRALSRHVGVTLGSKSRLASIVIPMLDEARQLPQLKESLDLLGKTEAGSLIEIIVADGGSADGSREIVEHWPDVRLVRAGEGSGRGTAIRDGVAASRGRTVCVFHADNEYAPDDAEKLLALAEASPSTLYIASRTHGAGGAYALRKIYSGHRFQYWVSRTGGVLVSAVLSLRLGRVISDPFCGVLAGQHDLVAQHFRYAGDVSSTIRGIMSAHRAGVPIVEVGVSYQPRDRAAGKKTGVRAGLGALWAATVR